MLGHAPNHRPRQRVGVGGVVGSCDRVTTGPADAARLEAVTPTTLFGVVGRTVAPVPTVRVTNRAGEPVPGVTVHFAASGGSTVTNTSALTDRNGVATARAWTMGRTAGKHTLTVASTDLPPVAFTVTAQTERVGELIDADGGSEPVSIGEGVSPAWRPTPAGGR